LEVVRHLGFDLKWVLTTQLLLLSDNKVSLAAIIHTEASVSSAAQLGHCCSSFLYCCSETLELSSTELSNCFIR